MDHFSKGFWCVAISSLPEQVCCLSVLYTPDRPKWLMALLILRKVWKPPIGKSFVLRFGGLHIRCWCWHPKVASCCCLSWKPPRTACLSAGVLGDMCGITSASCGWFMPWLGCFERRCESFIPFSGPVPDPLYMGSAGTPGMAQMGSPASQLCTGTSSSTCLIMWWASSVLAWKETTHCFLGSFFAGWTGWVNASHAQTHSGTRESQGVRDTALGSP